MTRILVANRGEIAIRVLTAAAELGYQTAAVYSDDKDTSHCDHAHVSVKLRSPASFLNPQHIIEAAKSVQATAIHPGYGFLSESTELANQCQASGILFIGPSSACIDAVGDKVSARQVALAAGVPVIPGLEQSITDPSEVYAFANQHGYPIMLKARDGGGGRGIRMVHTQDELPDALQRCINESPSKQVFVEKAVTGAKHIEVQILGDRHGGLIHLLERDCSAQRRYQKILEVAPCPSLPDTLRAAILDSAVRLGRHIRYDSAGTVEFLVRPDQNAFYFLEVNPRIQVEHTISEQINQVDLVQSQIRVAFGERLGQLGLTQDRIHVPRLVSIQARVVAENPWKDNMLSVGRINHVAFPQGQGIRVDTWISPGCVVLPSFDSLLAKVIVTGQSFADACAKLKLALARTEIQGVDTNLDFLSALLDSPYVAQHNMANLHIKTLEEQMPALLEAGTAVAQGRKQSKKSSSPETAAVAQAPTALQFKPGDAFNMEIADPKDPNTQQLHTVQIETISTNNFPDEFVAHMQSASGSLPNPFSLTLTRKSAVGDMRRKASSRNPNELGSPVTGMVVEFNVQEGDIVEVGQQVFVVSAMKMETVVKSSVAGRVQRVCAKENDLVEAGDLLLELAGDSKL